MKRKPYRFFLYLLLKLGHALILILPYRSAVFLGGFFGGIAYTILPKYRVITLQNLHEVFAGEKEGEIKKIAKDVFRNLGRTAAEYLSLPKLNKKNILQLVDSKGFETIKRVLSHRYDLSETPFGKISPILKTPHRKTTKSFLVSH